MLLNIVGNEPRDGRSSTTRRRENHTVAWRLRHQADQGTFCQAHTLLNIGAIEAPSTDGRLAPKPISTRRWVHPKVEEDPLRSTAMVLNIDGKVQL